MERVDYKGMKGTSEVMKFFYVLIMEVITCLHATVRIPRGVQLKRLDLLYVNYIAVSLPFKKILSCLKQSAGTES